MALIIKKYYRVVLVGKTGCGKSSLGNSILLKTGPDKKAFKCLTSADSVTQRCQRERRYLAKHKAIMIVIDTPGLFDSKIPNNETVKEISKCIALATPGPHLFLFVIRIGRFTPEEIETLEILKKLFGKDVHKYVVIVFTGKDELEDDEITVEQFVHDGPSYLKEFVEECGQRYVGICNSPGNPSHDQDVEAVIELITKTIEENENVFYSEEILIAVEKRIQEEIRKIHETDLAKTEDEIREEVKDEIESKDDVSELDGLWGDIGKLTFNRVRESFKVRLGKTIVKVAVWNTRL